MDTQQQQLLLKACCDAVPALRAWLGAPLLPTGLGGSRSQALEHKRGCVAAVCPPRAGGNLAGRKKPSEAPGMAGICVKLLSGIKGILSGSRYGRRDVGRGDLSPSIQEEQFTVTTVVYVLMNCLCHLREADPAPPRQHLWFLRGLEQNHLSHVFLT